ncbi:MAG TPA: cysteine desulfurase [Leeuwenhoekiella sp.]|nr:cysteine desulfurase [Leeuwenhoekiella sp.]
MESVYFDNAATTSIRPEVVETMVGVMRDIPGNPSSTHAYGRKAKSLVEQARKTIAKLLNVSAGELVFTSGGTEADNLIINSVVRDLGVRHIITSAIEHHAVVHIVEQLQKQYDVKVSHVRIKSCGSVDLEHLEELLQNSDQKTLVSLMHINNEIGNMLDLDAVCALCKQHEALFHSDMVQSVGHFHIDLQKTPVDFIAASAHKFHGPKGIGFAFIRKNSGLRPLIFGGGQERGSRAGTEAVHNVVGMEKALQISCEKMDVERAQIEDLKTYFIDQLQAEIPEANLNGTCSDLSKSTYTLINVCLPIPADKALMTLFQLDLKGIACSKGSACQSGSDQGSHVLNAFLSDADKQKPSVRFSFSHENTREEVDYTIEVLKQFIDK